MAVTLPLRSLHPDTRAHLERLGHRASRLRRRSRLPVPTETVGRLWRSGPSLVVVIPKVLARQLAWRRRDYVRLALAAGGRRIIVQHFARL